MLRFLKRLAILIIIAICAYYVVSECRSLRMPSRSYSGPLQPLDNFQSRVRDHLREHVTTLAQQIGERNLEHSDHLEAAAAYIRRYLEQNDYTVQEDSYVVRGKTVSNLFTFVGGPPKGKGIIVIGAHYDSVSGSPGADDNASGVAAVLELARILKDESPDHPIMLAFFPNEEAPFFQTEEMGSLHLARTLERNSQQVAGMISIESVGYYSDQPHSQRYPSGFASFYPNTGNFVAFVSNLHSRVLLHSALAEFRSSTHFPSEGASLPSWVTGVSLSDQWSFWQAGFPAIMITDTPPFRNPHYHTATDAPDTLDYDRLARVVVGLKHVAMKLAE
jgi:hypothetical protein